MPGLLFAQSSTASWWETLAQQCLIGLTNGSMYALIALGYTMVYGIIGLINFAHGDLFMLGAMLATTLIAAVAGEAAAGVMQASPVHLLWMLLVVPLFCAAINVTLDRIIYKPLRSAPKLAPLVSAIGVSFVFMNLGLFWKGASPVSVPRVVSHENLLSTAADLDAGAVQSPLTFSYAQLTVLLAVVPIMAALALFVKRSKLGTAMRATSQNPLAAQLMGINVERVIATTFAIGGALAGVASVVQCVYIGSVDFQMGYQNGLYAFTAAVLGGIGSIPGAVLGGLLIGLIKSLSFPLVGEQWSGAMVFVVLIVVLVFRPSGLLGAKLREKV